MRSFLQFLRVAWSEASVDWRPMILSVVGVSLGLLSQLYLGRFVDAVPHPQLADYAQSYSAFLLIGLAVLELQSSLVGGLGLRVREAQRSGALELYLATPLSVPALLAGLVAYDAIFAWLRLVGYLVVGGLLFAVPLAHAAWGSVFITLALASLAFGGLALIGAALTLELRRSDPLSMVLGALSIIACDVLYPSTVLPRWLAATGDLLPLRPALSALRSALRGEASDATMVILLAQSIALVAIGSFAFSWAYRRARRRGTLAAS